MSAHIVAVTSLLVDVLVNLDARSNLTRAEGAFVDLLQPHLDQLDRIRQIATREMQALTPALLAGKPLSAAAPSTPD